MTSNEKDLEQAPVQPPEFKHNSEVSLETAASDWAPDAETPILEAAPQAPQKSQVNEPSQAYVTLIEDPFGIQTMEIADSQNISDELDLNDQDLIEEDLLEEEDLDTDAQATADTLERVAAAIAHEGERTVQELETLTAESAQEAAERLAQEIAEDQALQAHLAQEAEEMEQAQLDPELLAALPKEPTVDENGQMDLSEMESCIEALLFMTDKPMSVEKLREHLGPAFSMNLFQEAVTSLRDRYQHPRHGIELVEIANGLQFRTKPGRAALAKRLAKVQTQRLSSGAMETLAIVAYKQPAMKEDVDKIRGVDSSHFIRGLLDKKLIKISGRSELPGRPMVYSTTDEFLELFGLKDLAAMPSLREIEQMVPASQSKNPEDEDPRVKEMRRLVSQMKSDTSTSLKYDPREDEKILQEIRERVSLIPTSTKYLDEQKDLEKQAALAAKEAALLAKMPKEGETGQLL